MWQPNIRRVSYPLKQWKIKIHLQYQTEEDSNFTFNPNIFQIHRLTIFWIKLIISSETIVFLKRHTNLREAIKGSFNFFYYVQSRVFVKCAIAVFFHVFFFRQYCCTKLIFNCFNCHNCTLFPYHNQFAITPIN